MHGRKAGLRIGTAGWSLPQAVHKEFPGTGGHLQRYSRALNAVEINSSFYRSHAKETYAKWAAAVPAGFRFAVKAPQSITHENRLRRARKPLVAFLAEVAGLGAKLGPLLIQLPPSLDYEARVARNFFALLRAIHAGPIVCEPRHPKWFTDRADQMLREQRIGRVGADPALCTLAAEPGGWGRTVYYRLHGSPRRYWSVYTSGQVGNLAVALAGLPTKTEAWCIFDNTAGGGAIVNALQLARHGRRPRMSTSLA